MTVIACRDGVMAADTAVWQGNVIVRHRQKISRLKGTGFLFAAAGETALIDAVLNWLNKTGEKPDPADKHEFGALILMPDGSVKRIDYKMRSYVVKDEPFHTEGSHTELLLGALAAGASAEQAVRIAIQYGDSAGGTVQFERI